MQQRMKCRNMTHCRTAAKPQRAAVALAIDSILDDLHGLDSLALQHPGASPQLEHNFKLTLAAPHLCAIFLIPKRYGCDPGFWTLLLMEDQLRLGQRGAAWISMGCSQLGIRKFLLNAAAKPLCSPRIQQV